MTDDHFLGRSTWAYVFVEFNEINNVLSKLVADYGMIDFIKKNSQYSSEALSTVLGLTTFSFLPVDYGLHRVVNFQYIYHLIIF